MEPERRAARRGSPASLHLAAALIALLAVLPCAKSLAGNPPGAVVSNTATFSYDVGSNQVTVLSNTVELTTVAEPSTATLALTRVLQTGPGTFTEPVGPTACLQGGSFALLADPILSGGNPIDPTVPQEVAVASSYNLGEPVFVRVDDGDQNRDFQVVEAVEVTVAHPQSGDTETLRLTETGTNTGVFAGYLPSANAPANPGDCVLQGSMDSSVRADYTDPGDAADTASATAVIDPVNVVFESISATPISGAVIELVDDVTGAPATVFGNDGISVYPSSIVSGSTVTDSGGTNYAFGPGQYRFPQVPAGSYRLQVTPPPDYTAPSTADTAALQALPGAPFDLGPGSFGQAFSASGSEPFRWDVPVDPRASILFLQKRTQTTTAAPGDFVRYELLLENASSVGAATDVRVIDNLPPGVRYVAGSATRDDQSAADPAIGPDLSTLEFRVSSLGVGERTRLTYVVEIIGGNDGEPLVNRATASASGGLVSNEATATVMLTEDLFRSTGTIIGRVLEGACTDTDFREDQGIAGVRIYLEDGRYAVSDDGGRFHFEGLPPGTHVAQLDTFTVPDWFDVVGCEADPLFAGRAESRFVRLSRGALQRADFYLRRKPAPEGRIDVELRNTATGSTERVGYELTLHGTGNVPVSAVSAMLVLPDGVNYEPGSLQIDDASGIEPEVTGQVLTFRLPDQSGNWATQLTLVASIDPGVEGELTSKALVRFDTPIAKGQKTPLAETRMVREPAEIENAGYVLDLKFAVLSAELSPADQRELDRLIADWHGVENVTIAAVGHSDSQRISARNRHIFADNYALSEARARAAAFYVAGRLGLPPDSVQVEGRGPDDPVADNATAAGRQRNRRVEMVLDGVRPKQPSFLEVTKASSGLLAARTRGATPGAPAAAAQDVEEEPEQVEPGIESLEPGVDMLLPVEGYRPSLPSTTVSIKHGPDQVVALWINNSPVNPLTFDSIDTSRNGDVRIARWKGVDLQDGQNDVRAVISQADGTAAQTLRRSVYFAGPPIRGELVEDKSTLLADGKAKPVVAIRFFDRSGRASRPGIVGSYHVREPYRSWWEVENDRRNDLVRIGDSSASYRIAADGIAYIELEPTTRTGEVTIDLGFENSRTQELRAWLRPAARDWILVGIAEGTAGYATLEDNLVAAGEAGFDDGYYDDGRVAFFAKGQIRGAYLLSLAYDSDRDRDAAKSRFDTVVDPDEWYPLYGDTSEQRFEAPSQRKLYVKLERNQFYALFGDFDTGLSVTELSRYERRFNGLRSEYRGDRASYNLFAAESGQAFNRDELRGDGTSGLYRLSRTPVIANSEQIRLEVRDRFDSGLIISSRVLSRFVDYDLDPLNGTLFFKQPVPSRDLDFNPVFIVAEYETQSTAENDVVAGARAALHFAEDAVEIGVTHINDSTSGAEADLTGFDLRWQLNSQTELKAEFADASRVEAGSELTGSAHSVTLEHNGEIVDLRAWLREVDDDFGLGQQSAADRGFRRLGVDGRAQITSNFFFEGEAGWQQNLETSDIRNLGAARLRYQRKTWSAAIGATYAADKFDDGDTRSSELADVTLSKQLFGKLTLRVAGSTALNDSAESIDFPTRFVVGADYRITPWAELVAEYEDASGADIDSRLGRIGLRATPWTRAQVSTFLSEETTEFGPRLFANVGLVQGVELNDRWTLDVGVDTAETLTSQDARQFDPDRELVSGSLAEDFAAAHAGALYTADLWTANARIEWRDADSEERRSLLFGWYRQPVAGHSLSAALRVLDGERDTGDAMTSVDLRFGWAYRPARSDWAFLNRTDLVVDDVERPGDSVRNWRVVNNFNANHRLGPASQLALQYAFKYVRGDFAGIDVKAYTDLAGVDWRHALGGKFDVGVNASALHSWRSGSIDYGTGVDFGYQFADNMWLSVGYNLAGFYDEDFAAARYTAAGPFLRFSIKADQRTLKDIAGQR